MRTIHSSFTHGLASACLGIFVVFSAHAQEGIVPLAKGEGKAAAVSYIDKDSKPQTLDASKAKLTALHYWATWCAPCVDELPMIDDTQEIYGKDLHIVPIALDGRNVAKVQKFYKDHKIDHLPVYLDPTNKGASAVGLKGLPGTLFLDPQGNIIARADGPLDWQREDVVKLLKASLK